MGIIDWVCCLCNNKFQAHDNRCPRCGHWISPAHRHYPPIKLTLFQKVKCTLKVVWKKLVKAWHNYCERVSDNFRD